MHFCCCIPAYSNYAKSPYPVIAAVIYLLVGIGLKHEKASDIKELSTYQKIRWSVGATISHIISILVMLGIIIFIMLGAAAGVASLATAGEDEVTIENLSFGEWQEQEYPNRLRTCIAIKPEQAKNRKTDNIMGLTGPLLNTCVIIADKEGKNVCDWKWLTDASVDSDGFAEFRAVLEYEGEMEGYPVFYYSEVEEFDAALFDVSNSSEENTSVDTQETDSVELKKDDMYYYLGQEESVAEEIYHTYKETEIEGKSVRTYPSTENESLRVERGIICGVSIDGTTDKTLMNISVGDKYDSAVKNVEDLGYEHDSDFIIESINLYEYTYKKDANSVTISVDENRNVKWVYLWHNSNDVEENKNMSESEYNYEALKYSGYYIDHGQIGYEVSFSAYTDVENDNIGVAEVYYNGELEGNYEVSLCSDWGDFSGYDYEAYYEIRGVELYMGFYESDGKVLMDLNTQYRNEDTLELVERFES